MKSIILMLLIGSTTILSAQRYKQMMYDYTINFYDVVKEAEKYFETHDKEAKGSGWKPYQRWLSKNEPLYFPTGIRNNIDPLIAAHSVKQFKQTSTVQNTKSFDNGWEEIGPYAAGRISSDTRRYPVGLGRIEDFYVNPNNTDSIYFVSRSGGFWKTIDGGVNWEGGFTDYLPATGVNRLTVNPNDPNEIFINLKNSENEFSHGIYHSTDAGDTWTLSNFNPTNLGFGGLGSNLLILELIYHPYVDDLIFIGTNRGVFRSDDNLSTTNWTRLFNSNLIFDINFHPTDDSIVYLYNVANRTVIYRSEDQGISYSTSNTLPGGNVHNLYLSTSADCANCLYVASQTGLWKSFDNGVNFQFVSDPPSDCRAFVVNDQDTSKMLAGYVNVFISEDGGKTWEIKTTGDETTLQPKYIKVDMRNTDCVNGVFYCATDGLLSRTFDEGETWEILTDSIGIREFYKLGVSQSNHYRTVGGSQDNGGSIKTENEWTRFHGGDGMEGLFHPLNDDWILSSSQYGSRKRTNNGGLTEYDITPNSQERGHWIAPLAYDPNDHMTIYDFREFVYKSTDFGTTFDSIGAPTSFYTETIRKAAIAENNSKIMAISYHDHIDKSTDGGVTFTEITNNLPRIYITDIAFHPNNDDIILVTYNNYQDNGAKIFMTTNGGNSWTNITYNLGNIPLNAVVIDHTDEANIYVGAEVGLYTMPLYDTVWVAHNPNLPNASVSELEIVYGTNTLRAALWGRGFWEYTLVGRNDFPRIMKTSISDQPTDKVPRENIDQYVTSVIEYNGVLSNVWLEWSTDTAVFNGTNIIAMSNTSANTWESNNPIPNQAVDTKVFFKVFASGSANDTTETYKFMFEPRQLLLNFCTEILERSDDAEESENGSLDLGSTDLELCADGSDNQHVGLRFSSVEIPQGAIVNSAYIEFRADESDNTILDIFIHGENEDNSQAWDVMNDFDISQRNLTNSFVVWSHDNTTAWVAGQTIAQTPDLRTIVQEIVDRPGWDIDQSMSFILFDNGIETDERVADSHRGGYPPRLCIDFSLSTPATLPIELITFSTEEQEEEVLLKWSTATEINNDYFTIERSKNGKDWEFVLRKKGAGNSNAILSYSALDKNPYSGLSYYRLKQTDFDNKYTYSEVKSVNFNRKVDNKIEIFPNPSESIITIVATPYELEQLKIYNMLGENVYSKLREISKTDTKIILDLSNLNTGTYYILTKTTANKVYKN